MPGHDYGEPSINPEVEEDGREHLQEMLRTDEEFRAAWEANRPNREFSYAILRKRLDLAITYTRLSRLSNISPKRLQLIENAEVDPAPHEVEAISQRLENTR